MTDETARDAIRAAVDRLAAAPIVVIVTCAGCGGRFAAIKPRRGAGRRYCSVICRGNAARARKTAEPRSPR